MSLNTADTLHITQLYAQIVTKMFFNFKLYEYLNTDILKTF